MYSTQPTSNAGEIEEKASVIKIRLSLLHQCYKESLFLDKEFEALKLIRDQINQHQDQYDLLLQEASKRDDQKS